MVSKNEHSIDTGNADHTRKRIKTKQKHKKTNTMCVGHYYPQTNTNNVNKTWALSQKMEVKTNQPSFLCGNYNTEPQTSSHIIGEHKTLKRWATLISMTGKYFVNALCLWIQTVFINIDRNLTALINQIKTNLKKC